MSCINYIVVCDYSGLWLCGLTVVVCDYSGLTVVVYDYSSL